MPSLRRFLAFRSHSVSQASVLLAATALLSNVLGLGRNLLFYRLVSPDRLDVYYASFRIADFLFNLLIFGAITSAFIPVVTELISHGKEDEARTVTSQMLSWATVFFVLLIAILAVFMPRIVSGIVPGFDAERTDLTVQLSRLMLVQTLFFSWSFIVGGLLNGYRRFATYAFAPLVYNAAIILGGLLAPRFGIYAITYAVITGAFLHFLIQYAEARTTGFRFHFDLSRSATIKEIVRLMVPRSISQGMGQVVLIAYTSLASGLQAGSIAIFTGINDLQTTPTVIVANSLATASFPSLAAYAAKKDLEGLSALLNRVMRSALFLLIPTVALALVLREHLIHVYFGARGSEQYLADLAVRTLVWFLIGIVPASLVAILARVFYAFKDTRTPMIVNVVSGLVAILTGYLGIRVLHGDVATLGLAEMLVAAVQAFWYLAILWRRQVVTATAGPLLSSIAGYLVGSVLAAACAYLAMAGTRLIADQTTIAYLLQAAVASLVGLAAYFGYSTIRSKEELRWVQKRSFTSGQ